ncbi:restriction endonuclease subunit S [Selenomonas bovis]|uniref:restriction endonuclease subunit S n=1 Tax=Selenomonas bovis TaxID=416586 RepID=UPI00037B3C1C|nr:restriction endonuclease subunit S [Selenomonas bovis]
MAKNKKEMTPEERLAAALVPEEEQPYELPEGWEWVRLSGIAEIVRGGSPRPIKSFLTTEDTGVNWIKIGDGERYGKYITSTAQKIITTGMSKSRFVHSGTLLLSNSMSFGRPYILKIDGCIHDGWLAIFDYEKLFNQNYLYYLLCSPLLYNQFASKAAGAVVQNLNKDKVKASLVPLPPLYEQQRLVARIESLFVKLDAAREKVQSVLDSHETRKAALLHDAFTGKLTAKWREEQGLPEKIYKTVPLNQVCDSIFDGDHMPPPKSNSGIPFLVIANVNKGKLNFTGTRFVPQDYYESLTDTRKPQNGDVLYTLVGTYGIPVLVDTDEKFCFQRHMALLKPNKSSILQKYLWYTLQEKDFYQQATKIAKGTAQLTVPIKGLRQLTIPLPSLPEQQEIVRILDRLLAREQRARQAAEETLTAIDRMKQSILARAFRGEL